MGKEVIHTDTAPAAIGAYSQAIKVNKTVYLSGQIPLNPATGTLISADFKEQTIQVFKNLQAVIAASGGDFSNVVKLNAYLTDLNHFAVFNEVMASFIPQPYPARAVIEVTALPKGALVEADAVIELN